MPEEVQPKQPRSQSSGHLSVRKKVLFAIVMTVGFFLLIETALAAFGFGVETDTSDPFVGFSRQVPLLEKFADESGVAKVRTAANKLIWFNDQEFSVKKPANTKRIFCLGGSTTFGRPYSDSTAFSGWLRELLPLVDDSKEWEVINAGGVSYASYRVAAVMEELADYEPDMFIVYTGQNEFLERRTYAGMFEQSDLKLRATAALSKTRTWTLIKRLVNVPNKDNGDSVEKLPGEVDEMLNHTIGPADYHRDDDWRDKVLHHYQVNLQRMIAIAQKSGAEIVFVIPASNEKNCSPFKSELKAGIADADKEKFNQWRDEAQEAEDDNLAVKLLNKTKTVDPEFADVDYALGRLLFRLGKKQQAGEAFARSLDRDICPLRAPSDFLDAIRRLAKRNGVPLVDFPERLRELCFQEHGHRILGEEYFLDHVHPTIAANRQLAVWIIERLLSDSQIKGTALTQSDIDRVSKRVLSEIDPIQQAVALRNLAKVLHWAGKFDEALPRATDALSTLTNDAESLLVRADCLRQTDRIDDAVQDYELLFDTSPMYLRAYMPYGELLMDLNKFDEAAGYLTMAVVGLHPDSPQQQRSRYLLGIVNVMLEEHDQAISLLEELDDSYENDPNRLFFLARAKAGVGDNESAIKLFQDLIAASPLDIEAMYLLSELLVDANRADEAIEHLEMVTELDPSNDRAKESLKAIQAK